MIMGIAIIKILAAVVTLLLVGMVVATFGFAFTLLGEEIRRKHGLDGVGRKHGQLKAKKKKV
jgi:hypothetical protein